MMKRNHTRHCATAAIAAAVALSSTPLLAQVAEAPPATPAEPVMTFPEVTAPPPAQATIVVPTELPQAAPPPAATVTTPQPATTRQAAPAPVNTTTERATPRAVAAPAPARTTVAAPAEPAASTVEEPVAPIAAVPVAEPAPVAVSEPAADAAPENDGEALQFGVAVLAAIAALALAIWGFVAIGRRKPVDRKAAALIERPTVAPRQPAPEVVATPAPTVTPLATARTAAPAPSLSHTGAAVPLPRTMPATFAERDALIKRMIAAKPDRANPFRSYGQRAKRAKLILQSLGRDFGDTAPWIDLGQYPQNWPELAGRKHAAA